MMKRTLLALAVLSLLATAFAPLKATVAILVHNNRESAMKITMDGPKKYVFTVEPGWTEKLVEQGTYEVLYDGCTGDIEESLDIKEAGVIIQIPYCPTPPEYTKFVVGSHFGTDMTVELFSQDALYGEDYKLTVELGTNRYQRILSGVYDYSYEACDTTFTGTIRILKNGTSQLLLLSCERLAVLEFSQPSPVAFKLNNNYTQEIVVTLIGPRTYFFTLQPGQTRVEVVPGIYTYIYAMDGKRHEGAVFVSKSGVSSARFPAPSPPRATE